MAGSGLAAAFWC